MYYIMNCTPLELYKLCSNKIIKNIYNSDVNIFYTNLLILNLSEEINEIILERYNVINHILNIENN